MNILNLPDWEILQVEENEDDYKITARYKPTPAYCPHCIKLPFLDKFGTDEQLYMDLPIHDKRVGIRLIKQRWRCKTCGKTFLEQISDLDEKRGMTKRLLDYVRKQSLKRSFLGIADDVGLDEKTVRNIFADYVEYLDKTVVFETPEWLGIDEVHIQKPRGILTNVKEHTILEMLANRNKTTISGYLEKLKDRQKVKLVAIDMWRPYFDAVKALIPKAKVVIDRFHVVKMANEALETIRKSVRSSLSEKQRLQLKDDRFILLRRKRDLEPDQLLILDTWVKNIPVLGNAYQLKEEFFDIWTCKSRDEALLLYKDWLRRISPDIYSAFEPLITALTNWETEIFEYFNHPITAGYTESLNGLCKLLVRIGRGYSFDVLRAKMLYSEGLHKKRRPKYWESPTHYERHYDRPPDTFRSLQLPSEQNFGVSISTLREKIQDGSIGPISITKTE